MKTVCVLFALALAACAGPGALPVQEPAHSMPGTTYALPGQRVTLGTVQTP